jgi:hypothetical protein
MRKSADDAGGIIRRKEMSDIETYFIGSILSGGSSDPKEGNSLEAMDQHYDNARNTL